VNFGQYAHPDFGYLCPAPRFRRELRVAFFATVFGAVIGAVSVIALSAGDREGNSASATQAPAVATVSEPREGHARVNASGSNSADMARNSQVRSSPSFASPPVRSENAEARNGTNGCEDHLSLDSRRQCLAEKLHRPRPRRADNGPDVARVPLGRPAMVEDAAPIAARADGVSNPSGVSAPSSVAHADTGPSASVAHADAGPSAPIPAEGAVPQHPHTAPAPHTKPHKIARVQNRRHKEPSERVAGVTLGMDNGFGGFGRVYARDAVYPRTGFWDWSR
jgi:hypothetical protein